MNITLAKLGYMTGCFETRIRIANAVLPPPPPAYLFLNLPPKKFVCGAGPDPIIAQPVQCGIDLGDQISCVDHFGGGAIQFSTVNLERAVEVEGDMAVIATSNVVAPLRTRVGASRAIERNAFGVVYLGSRNMECEGSQRQTKVARRDHLLAVAAASAGHRKGVKGTKAHRRCNRQTVQRARARAAPQLLGTRFTSFASLTIAATSSR